MLATSKIALKASKKSTMQEVSVGYPKLRQEWVINALSDWRDAQDWERVTVQLACDLSLFPYSSLVSPAWPARSKWDIPATDTCAVYAVLSGQRRGLLQMDFKNCTFYHCNITERCALNHMMCLLVELLVSNEGSGWRRWTQLWYF